ncbi:hypothetical protein [Flavobacterium litorale]|uniref:Uncharacterized protein n=1 Tax=Flavobacterium litorale TaxID=2856519 RepID=A0ABX8VDP9_9FLAO|nr:hypothetical protein [Flavobacterium litorale]QYJ68784.1 hypothetical protein K1I41_02575 [Flavobacterium litorale]
MKSTAENPFAFFEWYLKKQIELDLEEFYKNITEELYFNNVDEIDKKTHKVRVLNISHKDNIDSEYLTFSFEGSIKRKLNNETQNSINFLEQEFQKRFSDKKEVKAYADFLRIKIKHIESFNAFKEFHFLNDYLSQIKDTINRYSTEVKLYGFTPSFELLAENEKEQQDKIQKLYESLTESPSLINATKQEFFNAFTGKEVAYGIHWLVIGKNKRVSKPSLFHFVIKLIDENHLSPSIIHDLNKYVLYTFRDNNGEELKNLKQSKSYVSKNPTQKDRIENIISSL